MTEAEEHNFLAKSPEYIPGRDSNELMESLEQGGLDREKPKIRFNHDGSEVGTREREEASKRAIQSDKENASPDEYKRALGLPDKAVDNKHAQELINQLITNPDKETPADQMDDLIKNFPN